MPNSKIPSIFDHTVRNSSIIEPNYHQDEAFDRCVKDIRSLLGQREPPVMEPSSGAMLARNALMREVQSVWIEGVLNSSLHKAARLALGLEARPDAVADPWNLEFQQPEATPHPLPAGTRITQVYDSEQGELLILGAPGAGKTTLLLELARDLLTRAKDGKEKAVPAVFNLSSWAINQQDFATWLVEELNNKYQIPPGTARTFVSDNHIIPLLDGLDEMAPYEQTECIKAINAYRREHGLWPFVVCSRSTDYLAQTERVRLGGAVVVQPLTPSQISRYLSAAGPQMAGLRTALQNDSDLRELATTPLWLDILILAYQDVPLDKIAPLSTLPDIRQQIFDIYIKRMLARRSATSRYITRQTQPWLSFLAQRMKQRHETDFYIESIQPDWLTDERMRRAYNWFAIYLPYMLIGVLVSLAPFPIFYARGLLSPRLTEIILLGGLFGWLLGRSSIAQLSLAENGGNPENWSWRWLQRQSGLAALLGSVVGASFWWAYSARPLTGLIAGLGFGICCLLLMLLLPQSKALPDQEQQTSDPEQQAPREYSLGWKGVLRAILVGLLVGLSNGFMASPYTILAGRIATGLGFLLFGSLSWGLLCVLLNEKNADVQPVDKLNWSWKSIRQTLFSRLHVKWTLLITSIAWLFFGLMVWVFLHKINGTLFFELLFIGGISGVCYWLLFGIFRAVASQQFSYKLRAAPGQGIRLSALNALGYGLVVTILLSLGMTLWLGTWVAALIIGLSVGLLTGLFNGGMAFLRHCILRILLWRSGKIPWNYPRFLDAVTERTLLHKGGGYYFFLHRLLLEHLAAQWQSPQTELEQEERPSQQDAPPVSSDPGEPNPSNGVTPANNTTPNTIAKSTAPPRPVTFASPLPCGHERRPNARYCCVCGAAIPLQVRQLEG